MWRSKPRVDYKTLHSTGQQVLKSQLSENLRTILISKANIDSIKIFVKYWYNYHKTSINDFNHTNCIIYISPKH